MMKETIGKLTPKDCYIPVRSSSLEDQGVVLSHLYQPIVGRDAVAVFKFLEGEARLTTKEATHHTMMSYLQLPLDRVYEARVNLDAVGLLKTYKKEETDRTVFIYRLVPPFSAYQFFNDHMLSLLLIHEVGEEKFEKLKESFNFRSVDVSGFTEVTASFSDVFHPATSTSRKARDGEETISQQGVATGESHIDFEWLLQSLRDQMLPATTILNNENSKLINQLAILYQTTTADMEKAIMWSLTDENALDAEELKASCHDLAKSAPVSKQKAVPEKEKKEPKKQPVSKNEKFIQMLEDITPRELLEDVANGQKAADQDVKLIRDVMTEQGLPKGVMNVLVHYVLLKTDMKLSKPYLEKIASHWARKNVKTVEQAMNMARAEHKKYQQWGQEKRNYKAKSNEVLPEWYKKQKHEQNAAAENKETKEETTNTASEDEIAERIQRITQKRKGR